MDGRLMANLDQIADEAERKAKCANEHSLADAFRMIAELARAAKPKRGRPPKE